MIVKLLNEHHLEFLSLKRGCRGSSEFTLVKMAHCWKSHVMVHLTEEKKEEPAVTTTLSWEEEKRQKEDERRKREAEAWEREQRELEMLQGRSSPVVCTCT